MELDLEQYWTFGLALLIVLILIGILFWVIQKIGVGGGKGRRGSRLGIVEAAVVDRTRRLVLVRRDTVEHLVMIGGPQDVVIENNITRSEPSLTATATDQTAGGGPDLSIRPGAQAAAIVADPVPSEPVIAAAPLTAENIAADIAADLEPDPAPKPEPVVDRPEPVVEEVAAVAAAVERPREPEPEPAPREPEPVAAQAQPEPEPEVAAAEPPMPVREVATAMPAQADEAPAAHEAAPRAPEDIPRPTAPGRPWPPSEGRFREAQRRFAERSDYSPPGRGGRTDPAMEPDMHNLPERQMASRAAPDGMMPPERPREVSHEGQPREPANLNVRPGEDR